MRGELSLQTEAAAFFLKVDGSTAAELASLKGQMDAIEEANIQKKCGIEFRKS
jgi:hypothetical protein